MLTVTLEAAGSPLTPILWLAIESARRSSQWLIPQSRMSPYTGTALSQDRPFWIVNGRAYDLRPSGWASSRRIDMVRADRGPRYQRPAPHLPPGPSQLQKILAKYLIEDAIRKSALNWWHLSGSARGAWATSSRYRREGHTPQAWGPPLPAATGIQCARGSAETRLTGQGKPARRDPAPGSTPSSPRGPEEVRPRVRRRDVGSRCRACRRAGPAHYALIPTWAFVIIMVVTRTAAGGLGPLPASTGSGSSGETAGMTLPLGKALFDLNYVGTSLIGSDGHVLLHHPYLGSGADVKKTFFDGMLRLHPVLRVPGYTRAQAGHMP